MTYREETDDWDRGDAAPITPPDPGRGICPTCGLWAKLGEAEASTKPGGEEHSPTADAIWGAFCVLPAEQVRAPKRLHISARALRQLRQEVDADSYYADQRDQLRHDSAPSFLGMPLDEVPHDETNAAGWEIRIEPQHANA